MPTLRPALIWVTLGTSCLLAACGSSLPDEAPGGSAEGPDPAQVDLSPIKDYALDHAGAMKAYTAELAAFAEQYHTLAEQRGFDYGALWDADPATAAGLVRAARQAWIDASMHYELDEGIVAGVPQLADFDLWIDAGPPALEAPDEAYPWTLRLPSGATMDSPGNLFHSLLEPALYGTNSEFVGAAVDLNGDGQLEFTEVLPEADLLLGAAQALDGATAEMQAAIQNWQPTLTDSFTALVVMTPTMNEYFEQWKHSVYVAGESADEQAFVGLSRLFDIKSILNGLQLTYATVDPLVVEQDDQLSSQISAGYDELIQYVDRLYEREQTGQLFSSQEVDALGTEAQERAEELAALVAQAADQLEVTLAK